MGGACATRMAPKPRRRQQATCTSRADAGDTGQLMGPAASMPSVSTVTARSAAETRAAGRRLGEVGVAGDVLLLDGPLGAGKTVLVQGLASGLGYSGEVASPTFVLVRQHRGRLQLVHADLYRLEQRADVEALGLLELSADGVLALEW